MGRADHGNAAVAAVDARGHRAHGGGHAKGDGAADMTEIVTLEVEIRRRIAVGGPMPVAHYMELCLTDPDRQRADLCNLIKYRGNRGRTIRISSGPTLNAMRQNERRPRLPE